jgi:hypothetical protein
MGYHGTIWTDAQRSAAFVLFRLYKNGTGRIQTFVRRVLL